VLRMIDANDLERTGADTLRLEQTPAVMALARGRDRRTRVRLGARIADGPDAVADAGHPALSFAQADAYARRFPFLSPVVLPRGVVDLAQDVPPQDVRLVAPTASLVARDTTHPALIQLFVQTADKVHGGAGWFQRKATSRARRNTERPLAKEADRFYKNGAPLLQRYLPFWLANLIDRCGRCW
jgi:hypothetical protein